MDQLSNQNQAQQQASRSIRLQQESRRKIVEAELRRLAETQR